MNVEIPGSASVVLGEMDGRRWDRLGVRSHVAFAMLDVGGKTVARDTLLLPMYRDMNWPQAKIDVRWPNGKAVSTSKTFAFRVFVDLDGERALPDNYFDLCPGIPVELDWPAELGRLVVWRVGNEM